MFRTLLVTQDVNAGRSILECLEKLKVEITAAFWFHYDEEAAWRLVIVSPDVSSRGPKALYGFAAVCLFDLANRPHQPIEFSLDDILFVTPYHLLYKQVKLGTGLTIATGPVRNGVHQDVYVYKI